MHRGSSQAEGSPGVVEAVRVGKANVAAGSHGLRVTALHPHDGLGNASRSGNREAAHAAGDPGESRGMDSNSAQRCSYHGGDQGWRRGRVRGDYPRVVWAAGELGEQRGTDGAALVRPAVAVGARSGAGGVHEESELEEEVKLGICGHAKAHLVALALLVVFAHEEPEGGTALVGLYW